jgi:dTDP-4-dehydrorhamnose 3,5-epimerase
MKAIHCEIPGLIIFNPAVFKDERGFFFEMWNQRHYSASGLDAPFVQDNLSRSTKGTLRGLHFQNPSSQGKLATVLEGEVFDVAVDLRRNSPTFGKYFGILLSAQNKTQLYVPPGFAHGIQVVSETALFHYKCTEFYSPQSACVLRWDDPEIGIPWPIMNPVLSEKDRAGVLLQNLPPEKLFQG